MESAAQNNNSSTNMTKDEKLDNDSSRNSFHINPALKENGTQSPCNLRLITNVMPEDALRTPAWIPRILFNSGITKAKDDDLRLPQQTLSGMECNRFVRANNRPTKQPTDMALQHHKKTDEEFKDDNLRVFVPLPSGKNEGALQTRLSIPPDEKKAHVPTRDRCNNAQENPLLRFRNKAEISTRATYPQNDQISRISSRTTDPNIRLSAFSPDESPSQTRDSCNNAQENPILRFRNKAISTRVRLSRISSKTSDPNIRLSAFSPEQAMPIFRDWRDVTEETRVLTQDSYSFMMFVPFCNLAYWVAISVFVIQVGIFAFVMKDNSDFQNSKNPFGIPPNVSASVRASQLISLVIATFTQEDVRTSFTLIYHGFKSLKTYRSFLGNVTYLKYIISISCRLCIGVMGLFTTFLLIMTETSVLELFLNFTAIEFVSQLDDLAFLLSTTGFYGKYAKVCCKDVIDAEYKKLKKTTRSNMFNSNMVLLFLVLIIIIGTWITVVYLQNTGYFLCSKIYVQFGDDTLSMLGAFSGLYVKKGHDYHAKLPEKPGNHIGMAKFAFCSKDSVWTFNIYEPNEPTDDDCTQSWKARSEKTVFLDLPSASSLRWSVKKEEREVISQHLSIECLDCEYDANVCGAKGNCGKNECICDEGWYGLRCDFLSPCPTMEIDARFKEFEDNLREWSNTYNLFKNDNSDSSNLVEVYNRPVYIKEYNQAGGKEYDIILFTGRRWILFHPYKIYNSTELLKFLTDDYHAYWWKNDTISFISEPVDVGTPNDAVTPIGLKWYHAESDPRQRDEDSNLVPASTDIQVQLMCAICHNKTNPCFYDGVCNEESDRCDCSLGSSGVLCQITPVQDGKCDTYFNEKRFLYDGGDCCKATCQSGKYNCGYGQLNNSAAFGDIGFPHCIDPNILSLVSGSSTLSDIVERGYIRCGVSHNEYGFVEINDNGERYGLEVDICRAIGAAAMSDPTKVEFVEVEKVALRFKDLAEKKYDVLLRRTSVTAERDVYLSEESTGFSFSAAPYFYDGLRYAGIPSFRECADDFDLQSTKCQGLKICVSPGTTWFDIVSKAFPSSVVIQAETSDYASTFNNGLCNVVAGEAMVLGSIEQHEELAFEFEIGNKTHSKEANAVWTRQDDRTWSKFVSWVIEALIQAEQFNITKVTVKDESLAPTTLFGNEFVNMFQNAVAATGNYGEIYQKHIERYVTRQTGVRLNTINDGSTGLIYSLPLGSDGGEVPDVIVGSTLETIRKRGILNCGVRSGRIGLCEQKSTYEWSGFEVDICRGISSALFDGVEKVSFKDLSMSTSFTMLQDGFVDIIVSGFSHTLTREINETSTGNGFDFSPTYFYDGLKFGGPSPYGICADRLIFDNSTLSSNCTNTKICVTEGSIWLDEMKNSLEIPEVNIVQVSKMEEAYKKLALGECNVIAGESIHVSELVVRSNKYPADADYYVGKNKHTMERLAVVSRSDDAHFSDFIRWIIFGLFHAAEQNITKDMYNSMPSTVPYFGNTFLGMWRYLIKARGNYNEIFDASLKEIIPRDSLNQINADNSPQMYANVGVKKHLEDF